MILAAALHTILAVFFAILASLLMIVILLQRGKGVGLSGAFGGAGGGTAFGAKTGDVLTWITVIGAIVLLGYTLVLNFVFVPSGPGLQPSTPTLSAPVGDDTTTPETSTTPPAPAGSTSAPAAPSSRVFDQSNTDRYAAMIYGESWT